MQEQRDQVLGFFYLQGIGKEPDFKEPEDHISAEMNFMSLLSRQTYDAILENDEKAGHVQTGNPIGLSGQTFDEMDS